MYILFFKCVSQKCIYFKNHQTILLLLLLDHFKPWSEFREREREKGERMRCCRRFGADLEEGGRRWFRENEARSRPPSRLQWTSISASVSVTMKLNLCLCPSPLMIVKFLFLSLVWSTMVVAGLVTFLAWVWWLVQWVWWLIGGVDCWFGDWSVAMVGMF